MKIKYFLRSVSTLVVFSLIAYNYLVINNVNNDLLNEKIPFNVVLKSKIERNLSKNFIHDYSVDATCTLPYVSFYLESLFLN